MIRKKVRYKCQRGHTWERTIEQRGDVEVGEAVRCAVCGGGFVSFEIVEQTYEQRGAVGAIDPLRGGGGEAGEDGMPQGNVCRIVKGGRGRVCGA